ncbi:MAG: hypothetical protein Q8M83_03530 [bacterium]|nr:hypothetical protein [bacterium]
MLSTSKDILFIVLAVAVLWVTIFFCWLLYYFVAITREVKGGLRDARDKMRHFDEALHSVKDKLEHSVSIFAVLGETAKQLIGYFIEKKKAKKEEKKKK